MADDKYMTGQQFTALIDEVAQYVDRRAVGPLLSIVHQETKSYCDATRVQLNERLENIIKSSELERMQTMSELERRITKSIADNSKRDKIRTWALVGVGTVGFGNLVATIIILLKLGVL